MTPSVTPDPAPIRPAAALPPTRPAMDSVGMYLRRARQERGMSLDGVARATRISLTQLENLEVGAYDDLPGEAYTRGFVRSYASAVGADADQALVHYVSERRAGTTTLRPAERVVVKKGRPVGLLVACSVFLLLLVVATLAISRPRQRSAPGELSMHQAPQTTLA